MKTILVLLSVAILTAVIINTRSHPAMTGAEASSMTRLTRTSTQPSDTTAKYRPSYSRSAYDITPLPREQVEKLAEKLSPEEAQIILRKGTEAPFCGTLLDNKKQGVYLCRLCSLPLFSSEAKFNSGTGWPSFFQPVDRDHIRSIEDRSHGMVRTEILCARCDAHLGHIFDDGPAPTGLRYCLNSASLDFVEKGQEMPPAARPVKTETAYFAGGCFWGVEHHFQELPGVIDVVSGYQGGSIENPTYKQVCTGTTDHAEAVRVVYDPSRITYRQLLDNFFRFHDPTQLNRQGPDIGTQYRSAIFAADEKQLAEARQFLREQQKEGRWSDREIVTQLATVEEAGRFWEAEEYHQDYHARHGGACPLP